MPETYRLVDCGVDWLTGTCSDPVDGRKLEGLMVQLIDLEQQSGAKCTPWSLAGYQGFACGHCALAEKDGVRLVRLSSECAWSNWTEIYPLCTNVSRVDFQVTVSGFPRPQAALHNLYKQALRRFETVRSPPAVDLWTSNKGSATLYFNKRVSSSFGRCYDKGLETGLAHYEGCLRFEVEYKKAAATTLLTQVHISPQPNLATAGYVSAFFANRGIDLLVPLSRPTCSHVPKSKPHHSKTLRWLARSVRPCIESLMSRGFHPELERALGFRLEPLYDDGEVRSQTNCTEVS